MMKIVAGERFTPYSLAEKLSAKVLLESASLERGKDRYSILLVEEAAKIIQQGDDIFMDKSGKRFRLKTGKDILDVLLYFANQHAGVEREFPLPAGGLGYLSYEYCARFDTIKLTAKTDELDLPDALFILGHIFLIFDHYTDTITIVGLNYKEAEIDLKKAIQKIEKRLNDLDFNFMQTSVEEFPAEVIDSPDEETIYMRGVEKVREEIIRGNLLQGVLSRRVHIKTSMPAFHGYRHLRSFNPSPYMFYINCGEFELFGASPEVHVKVKNNRAILRPLAGTRKRGKTQAEEKAIEKDLLSDEKERAEHLMLVDLARNDLGRICRPGTVQPTEMMALEKYSHVMHIVSEVEGILKEGKTGLDALRATFPAGTVSGAPKIKAIEIIDALEKHSRRFYAGVVGYIEPGGNLDTCIVIRSAMKKNDLLILQAGAGIVYDSLPHKEFEETSNKLGALAKAVGVEV
ncbi:MAG: anthranilate synthase component I [Spirochaetales bacterium]|nr:anthranilate synthase component I [Spirochaetales bacterium]